VSHLLDSIYKPLIQNDFDVPNLINNINEKNQIHKNGIKAKFLGGKKEESKNHEEEQRRPAIIEEEDEECKVVKIDIPNNGNPLTQEILKFSEKVLERLYSKAKFIPNNIRAFTALSF
jgi:hypothetical protein